MADDMNNTGQGVPTQLAQNAPAPAQPAPQPNQAYSAQPQQPPATQPVVPQQPSAAPQPGYQPQPVYMPAPLMQLTGGMKFGWFVVGFLLQIPGIIIAWLVNVDKFPQVKHDALKWSAIGFAVGCVFYIIYCIFVYFAVMALFIAIGDAASSSLATSSVW